MPARARPAPDFRPRPGTVPGDAHRSPPPTGRLVMPGLSLLATTVTTFAPGGAKLATNDPSNTTGLVMVILVNLLIIGGGVILYLRHRRPHPAVTDGHETRPAGSTADSAAAPESGEAGPTG